MSQEDKRYLRAEPVGEEQIVPVATVPIADLPLAEVSDPQHHQSYEEAAAQFEKAITAGASDPEVHYLLAMAYKRQEKWNDARTALRKITKPDANVLLQMGLLSVREKQFMQAEGDFVRALQMDESLFAAAYNLLLTRLSMGNLVGALEAAQQATSLSANKSSARLLTLLQGLLHLCQESARLDRERIQQMFQNATDKDEKNLLKLVRSLGHIETVHSLLKALVSVRPSSPMIREAYFEGTMLKARYFMQRCNWPEAQMTLMTLVHQRNVSSANQAIMHNLMGCCSCVIQEFDKALHHFKTALKFDPNDLRVHQNLALTLEMTSKLAQATEHWDEVFELLTSRGIPSPPDIDNFFELFEMETLSRLANAHAEKGRWSTVLTYLHRAHRLRPDDEDLMERLFHVYQQAEQPRNARKMLDRLRARRPKDPQLELYELDLVEVKGLADIEYLLTEIEDILRKYPGDHRVKERAVGMVGNVVPLMGDLCDQLNEQLGKVYRQVRNLPRYQIDWNALNEIMRDLAREFRKLKRITGKCLPLVTHDAHKQIIRELQEHIEEKIEACRRLMD